MRNNASYEDREQQLIGIDLDEAGGGLQAFQDDAIEEDKRELLD